MEDGITMEGWKSALEGNGVRCADLDGTTMMPRWCADNWDIRHPELVSLHGAAVFCGGLIFSY